jgi:hypothetical protein
VTAAYEEVVFWRRNLFQIPNTSAGRCFVTETTRLLQAFVKGHPLEPISMKAMAIMSHLLLQRPHAHSTSHENKQHLSRRMELWQSGDIPSLLREARVLQSLFQQHNRGGLFQNDITRRFTNLMLVGKVNAAIRLVTEQGKGGVLPLSHDVQVALQKKHPPAQPANPDVLLSGCLQDLHPIRFAGITADIIRQCALQTRGAAGPSGADADQWRQMCVSFKEVSSNLCNALSSVARRLATEAVCSQNLEAFLANRLIPLDKCPGIRPIGIGEIPRRIIGKAIIRHLRHDIQQASGPIQLCAGLENGCEAAVHAMLQLFESDASDAVLLVDADNAFNRLNRSVALWNIQFICQPLAIFASNCYNTSARLFVTGGAELASHEGTTQGDPLSMPFYALALMPLMRELHGTVHQAWYADDAQACGTLSALREWWDSLVLRGPSYGYYVNASKTMLVVKHPLRDKASSIFDRTGIQLADGARDLGGVIGASGFVQFYVKEKVSSFCKEMEILSTIAGSSPQAAHSAYVHGLRHRWQFLQRTVPDMEAMFKPLEKVIRDKFIPALLGGHIVNDDERLLLSLPGRNGGFAIDNPVSTCANNHIASRQLSASLTNLIVTQAPLLAIDTEVQAKVRSTIRTERERKFKDVATDLADRLPADRSRAMHAAQERGASFLVTTLPLKKYGFALSKIEFRDQLLLRYRWPIPDLPVTCACGASFTIDHSQMCHLGGFINMRHDEVRDLLAAEMKKAYRDVETEPHLASLTGECLRPRSAITTDDARSDLRARGFWCRQQNAFFDIRVFYPHASSYLHRSLPSLFESMETAKKREYNDRILQVEQGSFTPLVFASTGGMGKEASIALKKLVTDVANHQGERYSHAMGILRCRISFALMRAAHVCLRGSRPSRRRHSDDPSDLIIREARVEL